MSSKDKRSVKKAPIIPKGEFTFSTKTDMSKDKAMQRMRDAADKPMGASKRRATSTFVQKLYRDEDELNDLKVLAGEGNFDSDVEDKDETSGLKELKKRDAKLAHKKEFGKNAAKVLMTTKVGKLKLEKGSVAMFAVNEVYAGQYAIVNHTRNVKGYISLKEKDWGLTQGQLIMASVQQSQGTSSYQSESSGNKNRKLQLSLEPKQINRGLTSETITSNMVLQGVIESKESKGYIVDLGLKDKAKAFVKFAKDARPADEKACGDLVHVMVLSKTSKVIKCVMVKSLNGEMQNEAEHSILEPVKTDLAEVTPHSLKPGFKISAKVSKLYANGIEVTFLGGMSGTIFSDHMSKSMVTKYKMGEKLQAVVISQDIASKATALSALPHILKLEAQRRPACSVGQLFNQVTVEKKVYGNSYLVRLEQSPALYGLLHKTNIPKSEDIEENEDGEDQANEETKDLSSDDAKKRAAQKIAATTKSAKKAKKEHGEIVNEDKDDLLDIGQVLPEVRVKEFNFFDGKPIISMLPSMVKSETVDYKTLVAGAFHTGTIEKVEANGPHKHIVLSLGNFVRGTLSLEHMADHPLKVIPPKFTSVGKEIKVRVFSVEGRRVDLTKKDSLMKDKVTVYAGLGDLRPSMPVWGVVVGQTDHGFVVKTFNGLKGLLRHDDVKDNISKAKKQLKKQMGSNAEIKPGCSIKAYCLFVKKSSGIALTLSKKKAKKNAIEEEGDFESLTDKFLPNDEEMAELKETYANLLVKKNKGSEVATYRVCESRANYHVLKTVNSKKATIALLPKCLATSFGIALPFDLKEFSFEALTIAMKQENDSDSAIPIVCAKPELIALKEEFTFSADTVGTSFIGLVESVSAKTGVTLRFSNGVTKLVAMRDIVLAEKVVQNYSIGQVVRSALNSTGRLSLKRAVVNQQDQRSAKRDQDALVNAFDKVSGAALESNESCDLKIGQKISATVQLVKDYGLILDIKSQGEASDRMTGFIVNDQKKKADKVYKAGETEVECIVLDIDFEKKIVELSERLVSSVAQGEETKKAKKQKGTAEAYQKAVVELNKEQYLVVSLKSDRSKVGVCILHGFSAESQAAYTSYSIGDEIDVKIAISKIQKDREGRFVLTQPRIQTITSPSSNSQTAGNTLEEGEKIVGTLKSIKGMCAFIQVGSVGKVPIIGRLHRVETNQKKDEFEQLKPGDKISAKILKKFEERGRTMIELTKRREHMAADGLDKDLVKLLSLETISNGQTVDGYITDVVPADIATKVSCPVQVQISPFVRSQLLFSDILDPQAILQQTIPSISDYISSNFKIGQRISLTYQNGKFLQQKEQATAKTYAKGDLAVVRFVKAVKGYGVTVQLDQKTFGVIETCEMTDDVTQNVALEAQKQGIFIARVIDQDKKGRLQLSARESVLHDETWKLIKPEGTSGKFMANDTRRQENANMRNKLLKYGAALTFKQGDLTLGYVTNISKAGCFIQVGHNTSMRAGLNELSDDQDYDFIGQMPIGRVVLCRITKASENNTRFDCSTRKSLIVYGVHQVSKNDLKAQSKISCIILATSADGVAFGQVKGSYHKLKIKGTPESATPGQLCIVELNKVTKEKITGDFVEFDNDSFDGAGASKERHFAQIYASVQEEARQDIAAAKKAKASEKTQQGNKNEEPDIEQLVANKRKQTMLEEQIRDLQQLDKEQVAESSEDDEAMQEDSDAEDMRRIAEQQEKEYESSEDENAQSDDDEEQGEEEDVNMDKDSEEDNSEEDESKKAPKKSGKKALRAQLEIEKTIRQKEAQLRSADGAAPTSVNDFERLLVSDYDQSYLWIQYMAFMLENLDAEAARRVAERAVKQVSMTAEDDKLNLWIAFMNLESKFGTAESLQGVVRRALDVNDRKKVYLQLINIYRATDKGELVEDIFKKLCKKYHESLEIWSGYIEFLFDMRGKDGDYTEPKTILQRALQALPKANHVNVISKFGMLEYKNGNPEHGRTMFEGIVSNYAKRMDIWSIYMDMEVKYGGGKANQAQARHLFERCLSLPEISKKPKKMKLVFRKYMEFENALGNENKLGELRRRVEQYLEQAFKTEENSDMASESEADKEAAAEEDQDEEESAEDDNEEGEAEIESDDE